MAKPFRKKKAGRYVGNFFFGHKGKDINLETKNAIEAHKRMRMHLAGESWEPAAAAARAGVAALDPTAPPLPPDPVVEAPPPTLPPPFVEAGPPGVTPAPAELPPEPLHVAAAAAAGAAGAEQAQAAAADVAADERAKVDAKLSDIMAKLGGGAAGGGDVLGTVCTMAAGLLLAAERKTIEWGGTWALRRRKDKRIFVPGDPPEIMCEALAAGLHGYAVTWFPDFAMRLTPGWAVVLGVVGGGGAMLVGARAIEPQSGGDVAPAPAPANGAAPQPPAPPA